MTQYTPRHGGARRARRAPALTLVKRPVVGSGIAIALIASVGAAVATGEPMPAQASEVSPVGARVSAGAAPADKVGVPAVELSDAERLATDRRRAAESRTASREQERLDLAAKKKRAAERKQREARERRVAAAKKRAAKADRMKKVQDNPKPVAMKVMRDLGFGQDQWSCLETLWVGESDWRWDATNASSGAYGIPQALPAGKMATAGADWRTNPETQIRWGLTYIKDSYGSPCAALSFWNSKSPHWY